MEISKPVSSSLSANIVVVVLGLLCCVACADLSFNFYAVSCPAAEFVVKNTVRSASTNDHTVPGKLLRLLFHDCFVEVRVYLLFVIAFILVIMF